MSLALATFFRLPALLACFKQNPSCKMSWMNVVHCYSANLNLPSLYVFSFELKMRERERERERNWLGILRQTLGQFQEIRSRNMGKAYSFVITYAGLH